MSKKLLIIILVLLVILGVFAVKMVLPKLVLNLVQNNMGSIVDKSMEQLDFSNATTKDLTQDITGEDMVNVQVTVNKGKISINEGKTENSIGGIAKYLGGKPTTTYKTAVDKSCLYTITSSDQEGNEFDILMPLNKISAINLTIGAGTVDADLSKLNMIVIGVTTGAGNVKVKMPSVSSKAVLVAGVGKLDILVPTDSERSVSFIQGASFSGLQLGDEYIKTESGFKTKGYDEATTKKLDIQIGQALGGFTINTY